MLAELMFASPLWILTTKYERSYNAEATISSRLIQKAANSEEVIIRKGLKAVAKLVALGEMKRGQRQPRLDERHGKGRAGIFRSSPEDELFAWH